jgi:2-phosphosulfolactate phosphatase
LRAKTIIHTTHAGTQGLVNAEHATELLTGAFVNAKATADYIRSKSPALVTLVRMGLEAATSSDEDNLCADYLENLLMDNDFDASVIEPTLRKSPFAARFFDPAKPWNPPSDFELCLNIDAFDFAIKADTNEKGRLSLRMIPVEMRRKLGLPRF